MPRLVDALVGVVDVHGVGDEQHRAVGMVQDREVGREEEAELGHAQLIGIAVGDALPPADGVVGQIADHASGEGWQALGAVGAQELDGGAQRRQRIALARDVERGGAPPGHGAVAFGEKCAAAYADEGEARVRAPMLGRLQEEGARSLLGELAVEAHRSLAIGEQAADHGDHASPGRELAKAVECGCGAARGREREAPGATLAHVRGSGRGVKQVRDPV